MSYLTLYILLSAITATAFFVVFGVIMYRFYSKKPKSEFFEEDINVAAQRAWEKQRSAADRSDRRD